MKTDKIIYLIDGSAYIYRAYHAIRALSNSKGFPTNAIFGFTRILLKLIQEKKPEYTAIFFDSKEKTFRHKIFKEYKANRPSMPQDLSMQIPYIKEITKGFCIPSFEMQGFEADDLIGTIAKKVQQSDFSAVLVTGDKDFMQLVTDKVFIWDPMKDIIIDIKHIKEKFGIQPLQFIDVMGLSGDTSDNIPGVPGIGPKTALSLIKEFNSIDNIYSNIDTITKKKQKENLIQYKEQALLSRKLVKIDQDVPIDFEQKEFNPQNFKFKSPDNDILAPIFKELEFRKLQEQFPQKANLCNKKYNIIFEKKDLNNLIKILEDSKLCAVDTETTSLDPMDAKIVGISFSVKNDEAFYIPCGHDYSDAPNQLELDYVLSNLRSVLENFNIKKIGQNIKYDWMVFERHGIDLQGVVFDTMLASYLINPSKRSHSLDQIALDFIDHNTIKYEDVAGSGKSLKNFSQVPIEQAGPYSCEDSDITFQAYTILSPILDKMNLKKLFDTVEMPLVPVLKTMERTGIKVDRERLGRLSNLFEQELLEIENKIYDHAGEKFNIQSSQQLGHILFEKLNLPVQKKTKKKTGFSTDMSVLTALAEKHELPALLLRHRTLNKLKSTYTDSLVELINSETGRIHTSFNQTITATGRLSSSKPNLQNIPIRSGEGIEIRKAFIPEKDNLFLSADYSQIELRLLAHYSEDEILIESFMNDEDIHTRTAAEVFQVFPSFITPELRRQAKAVNFGIIYGMGAYKLSKELEISRKMAQQYIDNYFGRYKGVRKFIDHTIEQAKKDGYVHTLLGRIRMLPDISSSNKNTQMMAERAALNTKIQGTAADLIKLAMINMDLSIKENKLKSRMILSVHDEIVFEVEPNELDTLKKLAKQIMEGVWELEIPLKVNISYGKNWAEAH